METGGVNAQPKEFPGLPETTKSEEQDMEQIPPQSFQKELNPANTLISDVWLPKL